VAPEREEVLKSVDRGRREFLRTVIAGAAFAPPLIMSFSMDGLSVDPAQAQISNQFCAPNGTVSRRLPLYLRRLVGPGGAALALSDEAPDSSTLRFVDSPALSMANGNQYQVVGQWSGTTPVDGNCVVLEAGDLEVWLGLKNSDDQGTQFDLRARLFIADLPMSTGETTCITGLVRNAALAKKVAVSFPGLQVFNPPFGHVGLIVEARIGTGPPPPGHSTARGLRLYSDAVNRDSHFDVLLSGEQP
jgi:hypothetical protein